LLEIGRAAEAHCVNIVALSFSVAFPARKIPAILQQLRGLLPDGIELWAGGGGVAHLSPPPGVYLLKDLSQGVHALSDWRTRHTPG